MSSSPAPCKVSQRGSAMLAVWIAWLATSAPASASILPAVDQTDRLVQASGGAAIVVLGMWGGASADVRIVDGLSVGGAYHLLVAPLVGGEEFKAIRLTQRLWSTQGGPTVGVTTSLCAFHKGGGRMRHDRTEVQPALNLAFPLVLFGEHRATFRMTYGPMLALGYTTVGPDLGSPDPEDGSEAPAAGSAPAAPALAKYPAEWKFSPELAFPWGRDLELVIGGATGVGFRGTW